jgi:BON domain
MARDYENLNDIQDLDDRELRDLVHEHLAAHGALDVDDITISVQNGHVLLAGRVGTDGERRIAEHVLTDVVGVSNYANEIVVDPIRRGLSPEAIDEHLADEAARAGTLLGDVPVAGEPSAQYAADANVKDELDGSTDYEEVTQNGVPWNPPSSPTPEGYLGSDVQPEDMGEQH